MPELTAAQRHQGVVPIARKGWRCPVCGARGFAQNSRAACIAGTRHFEDEHDPPRVVSKGQVESEEPSWTT